MSSTELQERRSKGLCYNYNDKWNPGHRCKKIFLIENDEDDSTATPVISLHAISGIQVEATILIDSESTHNFISNNLAQRVGLKPHPRG
ncbi:hypothetical protein AMTRI_Chr03g48350 [Amborella trichopoda]